MTSCSGGEPLRKAGPAICASSEGRTDAVVVAAEPAVQDLRQGRNVSGRLWKPARTARSTNQFATGAALAGAGRSSIWEAKTAARREKQLMKEREAELVEEKKARKVGERERRTDKKARKQRAEMRNTVTQEISSAAKLKTMSKKQLRSLKRTRVSKEGEIELIGAYAPTVDSKKRQKR